MALALDSALHIAARIRNFLKIKMSDIRKESRTPLCKVLETGEGWSQTWKV